MGRRKSSDSLVLGLVQMSASEDPGQNLDRAVSRVKEAAQAGARIICLQELFLTPYFPRTEDTRFFGLAEPVPGPATRILSRTARATKTVLICPLFEKRAEGIYHNTAVVIDADGTIAGKYRKTHIPDDPSFYEKFYFTPGDLGFRVFETRYARVGVLVCWDQWFPEAARLTALRGAQILFYPTAIGADLKESPSVVRAQRSAWETVQRSHAIANGVFVAAVNRVGTEGELKFWGGSFAADPFGGIIAQAGGKRDEILLADCDLAQIDETRVQWPFLRDRRIDVYDGLTARFLDEKK
jgi:N-carbamoylputrescine amidase